MSAPARSIPMVEIERDELEADIDSLNEAMLLLLDIAFVEKNSEADAFKAIRKVHEAAYSLRRWNDEPLGELP